MSENDNSGAAPLGPGDPTQAGQPYQAPPPMWVSPESGSYGAPQTGPAAPQYGPPPTGAPGQFQGQAPYLGQGQPPYQGQPQGQYQPQYQPQDQPPWGGAPGSGWPVGPPPANTGTRHRNAIISASISAVVIVAVVIAFVIHDAGKPAPGPAAAPVATSTVSGIPPVTQAVPTVTASASGEPVGYFASDTAARNVGIPTFDPVAANKTYTVTIETNRGNIVFTAVGANAPYTVYNFVYLTEKAYYNNTPCHRLTTSGIYVLQCGDPTGTGSGGPGYAFQDENLNAFGPAGSSGTVTYPAGAVAMANAGPDTNGSQFFLVYQDSPLPPAYTPFGTITSGMNVLTAIAAKGSDNSNATGDGKPNESVQIEKIVLS